MLVILEVLTNKRARANYKAANLFIRTALKTFYILK